MDAPSVALGAQLGSTSAPRHWQALTAGKYAFVGSRHGAS